MNWERVGTLDTREVGGFVTQYSSSLIANAKPGDRRLLRYRPFVQRCRIWLVDGCLSFVIGEAGAGWKMGI
jgi:hypothetical protein